MYIKVTDLKIYETDDATVFKKLLGNREVTQGRVNNIINSIKKVGYVTSPIIVNEKYEIIDGQGRVEALKTLGMPIHFVIHEGAGVAECISMNIKRGNWSLQDYINSYATQGNEEYKTLVTCIKKYRTISAVSVAGILHGSSSRGHGFNKTIEEGNFVVRDYKTAIKNLDFIKENINGIKQMDANTATVIDVLSVLCRERLIDLDRMTDAIAKYGNTVRSAYKVSQALDSLQELYNYNKKSKLYFRDAYSKVINRNKIF